MASSLVKFVGQLTNQVKFEVGVAAQAGIDGRHGHSIRGHRGERLRRTDVGAVMCQPDQVIGKRKAHDVLLAVKKRRVQFHYTGDDVKQRLDALPFLVEPLSPAKTNERRRQREFRATPRYGEMTGIASARTDRDHDMPLQAERGPPQRFMALMFVPGSKWPAATL